ncbi:MAG: hypothetical protein LBQ43_04405 [Holosporales bacterium]|jgi:hypothetical protein|nr:hypothetical protein [Holosporales bacterium]
MGDKIVDDSKIRHNSSVSQKDIFRLATLLYSETTNTFSNIDVQLYIVKCIFAEHKNAPMTIDEIISNIITSYKYNLSEEELSKILSKHKIFEIVTTNGDKAYKLSQQEYEKIDKSLSKNVDYYINQFILDNSFTESEAASCRDAIYQYIYELTTTNINSYKILFSASDKSRFTDSDLSVNVYDLTDIGRKYVHDFVEWENAEKNITLGNIVFCCLEYCLMVSGDKPISLISDIIRNREIYLDTNIIFRALGINGLSRKNVIVSFLKKCQQAEIKIIISKSTKTEFFSTIDYYISQINTFPRGKVFMGAYEGLTDYNFYSFYDDWHNKHEDLSLKYFRIFINSSYDEFVEKFKISDNIFIPSVMFNSQNFKNICDTYAKRISDAKKELKSRYISDDLLISNSDRHDASMVRYIELYRSEQSKDMDVFFVSSDKALRYWDMTREKEGYPVIIYPSQLFLILIKLCGRSENDLESFVHFINIRPRSELLTSEKANIIISGISSITEDIKTQKSLVSSVFNEDFQNIIRRSNTDHELYQNTQLYSQKYLEQELKLKEEALLASDNKRDLENAKIIDLTASIQQKKAEIKGLEWYKEISLKIAEEKSTHRIWIKWYILPSLTILYSAFIVIFIALQFLFCETSWNFVNKFIAFINNTTFGKEVRGSIYIIDGILITSIYTLFKLIWKNPLNKNKQNEDKKLEIERILKEYSKNTEHII